MKLLEIIGDERYKSAPPEEREVIIKDWYENIQKDPRFTPDLKSSIQKDIQTYAVPTFRSLNEYDTSLNTFTRSFLESAFSIPKNIAQGLMERLPATEIFSKEVMQKEKEFWKKEETKVQLAKAKRPIAATIGGITGGAVPYIAPQTQCHDPDSIGIHVRTSF